MDAKELTQAIDTMPIEDVKTNFTELLAQSLAIEASETQEESEQK